MNRDNEELMKIKYILFAVLLSLVACAEKPAIKIHVSPTGDDNNTGEAGFPVQSIAKARDLATPFMGTQEVQIILGDGIYYLPQTIVFSGHESGSEKYPVIYKAENRGKAILSGGSLIEVEWEPYEDGVFKSRIQGDIVIDQLYVNGKRQRMARFPNAVEGKNVFDTWDLVHTVEADPANDPLSPDRTASWSDPEKAYIHAMHSYLWGDMHWQIKGRKKDGSLDYEGGFQNNRPSPMHPRYRMVENVFEELDTPGEWYYNSKEQTLYYFPERDMELDSTRVEIVRLKHLVEFKGDRENPAQHIRMEGFVFRHAARTFMENKEPLLRSDWTTYRGGALFFDGAEDCKITDCEFDQLGGNSIFVNNYNRRIMITGCYIHESGANGVAFVGDPSMVRSPLFRYGKQDFENMDRTPGPKGDNFPEECVVEDCIITMTGRDEKQTSPVQISMSHKIQVVHCSIYDVPRAGINISEGTFGGHIIEHCDIFNTVLETGDHGSFNSWGRDRFWTPDVRKTVIEVSAEPELPFLDILEPSIIRNNRFRCDHGWDIDLDDGSTRYRIYNNLLLNGGLKMREGYDRIITNNIIVNNSLHPHVWYAGSGDVFKGNIVFAAHRPARMEASIAPDGKWGAELDSNLFVTNHQDRVQFAINGCDENSLVADPDFIDPENGDFRVNDNSPAFQIGFKNFPMDQFGVISQTLKNIAKKPLIPEVSIHPDTTFVPAPTQVLISWLGASLKEPEESELSAFGVSFESGGVALEVVPEESEAALAGFVSGDLIQSINGKSTRNMEYFRAYIHSGRETKDHLFEIIRNQAPAEIILNYPLGTVTKEIK